ncbi:4-alpha-L-fucosyltransferase [Mortierella sp. GBA30]|nr:4-alpha-L-fucosyltransferase [Mortierella sp. GBA30]
MRPGFNSVIKPLKQKLSRRVVIVLAVVCILSLMLLQLQVIQFEQKVVDVRLPESALPVSPALPALPASSSITYLHRNLDEGAYKSPFNIEDFCNKLPAPRNPQGLLMSKPRGQPIKIFYWRQIVWGMSVDWEKESRTLCPFPLSLQPFFDHYREARIMIPTLQWDSGYAPCVFWSMTLGSYDDQHGLCNTKTYGEVDYIITGNYTEFEEADIVHMNSPFFDYVDHAPYFDHEIMPPRIAHQRWTFQFHSESVGYYPHVAVRAFLQQFDLTIGSPPTMMDIPLPIIEITTEVALTYANIEPAYPLDKKPKDYIAFLISNCHSKNDRNDVMAALLHGLGAHSYGKCNHNRDIPLEFQEPNKPGKSWVAIKHETLAHYPFIFAPENSNCIGYITEKIYDALFVGAIPVYMGAPDIADYVPEGSYINVADFKSYDDLVEYIKTVDRAPFYEWKEIVKNDPTKFCRKCFTPPRGFECNIVGNIRYV